MAIETKKFIVRVYADDTMMAESESFDIWHNTLKAIHIDQKRIALLAAKKEAERDTRDPQDDDFDDDGD